MHAQNELPILVAFELSGHGAHFDTSAERKVPAGHTEIGRR